MNQQKIKSKYVKKQGYFHSTETDIFVRPCRRKAVPFEILDFKIYISFLTVEFIVYGTRYVGSGIRRMGSGITALGSEITDHGIGISSFLGDQGSGYTIFVGSGTKIGHALEIKDQKYAYKNGICSDEKTHLVTTLL